MEKSRDCEADSLAFSRFRASAKKAAPTRKHRPALWENMLGTVYARNASGITEYFDYNYQRAIAAIGPHHDVRVSRVKRGYYDLKGTEIPAGKLVWFVIDGEAPDTTPVEGYGVKGMKSKAWRRSFSSVDAMNAWVEKNDAQVLGTRELNRDEVEASR